jgi:predicted CopG family antitoxin
MVTKTLTITEQAYEALKRRKKEGQSFSQTILAITAIAEYPYANFKPFLSEKSAQSIRDEIRKSRELDLERQRRLDARRR